MMNREDRMIELLEELVKWTKVTNIPHVKNLLKEVLVTPEEKIAYEKSDGKKTVRQVAKQVNVGKSTISGWWKNWIMAGIAKPISAKGGGQRAKKLFSLKAFGIKVPKLVKKSSNIKGGKVSDKQASEV